MSFVNGDWWFSEENMRIMISEKIMIVSEYLNVMLQNTENNYQNVINYVKHLRPLSLLRKVEIFPRRGTL